MAAKLRIAGADDREMVRRLVEANHEEAGIAPDIEARDQAIDTLLTGEMPGALYLIGPPSSPVGYLSISFGHSISQGGTEAHIDEIYVRPQVRGRGMGSEALRMLAKALAQHGVRALHIRLPGDAPELFRRLHFREGPRPLSLTREL